MVEDKQSIIRSGKLVYFPRRLVLTVVGHKAFQEKKQLVEVMFETTCMSLASNKLVKKLEIPRELINIYYPNYIGVDKTGNNKKSTSDCIGGLTFTVISILNISEPKIVYYEQFDLDGYHDSLTDVMIKVSINDNYYELPIYMLTTEKP